MDMDVHVSRKTTSIGEDSMTGDETAGLIESLRLVRAESAVAEVKSGAGGFPDSVVESLVSFANTEGGTILIGIDEAAGFVPVDLPDPGAARDHLVGIASDAITPPLRIQADVVRFEGKSVVTAFVPPLPVDQRPAFVTRKGVTGGAYIRVGDGDRLMTHAEIALTVAGRAQPTYDCEEVPGTSRADLDEGHLLRALQRVRSGSSRMRDASDEVVLHRLGITTSPRPDAPLTLAGLLTFGEYPQQYFPQLMVSVVVRPAATASGPRFLDNVSARGPIPEMVQDALDVVTRNVAVRAIMSERGRRDEHEYPLLAVREAIVNALLHRDYSPVTRGTQVQVELDPEALVIRSPGGLFGGISTDELGESGVSASRNARLAVLLADTYLPHSTEIVAENRGSGVPEMISLARSQGLPRPEFRSKLTSFTVTMKRSELLSPEVRRWIDSLRLPRTHAHEIAAAMLRSGYVTNEILREWGVDRVEATAVLRDLVSAGVAAREGGRRYARYVLADRSTPPPQADSFSGLSAEPPPVRHDSPTEAAIRRLGSATSNELAAATGKNRKTVLRHLDALIEAGLVEGVGAPRSTKRRYRWTGHSETGTHE